MASDLRACENWSLDDWLAALERQGRPRFIDYCFPTDTQHDEFMERIQEFPDATIRLVLTRFLIPSGTLGIDEFRLRSLHAVLQDSEKDFERMIEHSYFRRLLRYSVTRRNRTPPWEGNTWILDLLPHWPRLALQALKAYTMAHIQVLPDGRIDGLYDALSIIRARYIGLPGSQPERLTLLKEIGPRDFEHLADRLYAKMGFETTLTPPTKDGGRDIECSRSGVGDAQAVLVECKRWEHRIGVQKVRALLGVVSAAKQTKGVLITTGAFTRGAREFAASNPRIELIDGPELVVLLNEHFGARWPEHLDRLIVESKTAKPNPVQMPSNTALQPTSGARMKTKQTRG